MPSITVLLDDAFRSAIRSAFGSDADPIIAPAQNPRFGDYQCNAAMGLARQLSMKPRDVAMQICKHLDISHIGTIDIAGPGFINVTLSTSFLQQQLTAMAASPRLGGEPAAVPERVVVDYSAPNVAKQMHVGNMRSTIIGDAICRVLAFRGEHVIRQNHIGDWGTQFGMLIAYLRETDRQANAEIADLDQFYKSARKRFDADETFADESRATVVRLQAGGAEEMAAWQQIVGRSRAYFEAIYRQMGVQLTPADERGESFYNPLLPAVVNDLQSASIAIRSEGAITVFADNSEAPLIIEKTGGGYGYATTDLAALRYRVATLGARRIIYVVGSPQSQHFKQVFAAARRAGWTEGVTLEHAAFGSILGGDGKMLKTRSGESVKLADLLEEALQRALAVVTEKNPDLDSQRRLAIAHAVGIGAVKYADLSKDRIGDYVFSFDQMLSLDGNTAPYLQYAHARICSILRKAAEQRESGGTSATDEQRMIGEQRAAGAVAIGERHAAAGDRAPSEPAELALAKHLLRFGDVVAAVARELKPHLLCTFIYELAAAFSGFYENCPVLKSEPTVRANRLALCDLTRRTIAMGLDLLVIEHPDAM